MSASAMLTVGRQVLDELDELGARREESAVERLVDDLALRARVRLERRHDLVPDRRHLRTVVRADDGGQDVAAESGTRLEQDALLVVDREPGAVGGQARP